MRGSFVWRREIPRKGAYVEAITLNEGEHEVLFPPGLKYRVKSKGLQTIGGRNFRVIEMEIDAED